jgi:hypothetical protein
MVNGGIQRPKFKEQSSKGKVLRAEFNEQSSKFKEQSALADIS